MKCDECKGEFENGQGVEHELDSGELLTFCSIGHFKKWYANQPASEPDPVQ